MKRILGRVGLVLILCGVIGGVIYLFTPREPVGEKKVVYTHFSDTPKRVYKSGQYAGERVRIAFPIPLTQTDDPLVWTFSPGGKTTPNTYRIHFDSPPTFPVRMPVVVEGTVDRIEPDLVIRTNGVPGVVIIRFASVAPRASP